MARDYPASGFPEFDRCSHASFPAYSPLHYQDPGITILGGSWLSLTPFGFDKVNSTAVAYEHINGEYVKDIEIFHINQSKIEIGVCVTLANHP